MPADLKNIAVADRGIEQIRASKKFEDICMSRRSIFCKLSFIICGALLASQQAHAHGGGLNAEGCHNNRKTGDYHCHRDSKAVQPVMPQIQQRTDAKQPERSDRPMISYNRDLYAYKSYPTRTNRGFYTGRTCNTNIDHVVSLKDAHYSGAGRWSVQERIDFANDKLNHVPACSRVNSSKGASTPSDFFRKSADGKGMEYEIEPRCAYLGIYYQVKRKYALSFDNNKADLFISCGLNIK